MGKQGLRIEFRYQGIISFRVVEAFEPLDPEFFFGSHPKMLRIKAERLSAAIEVRVILPHGSGVQERNAWEDLALIEARRTRYGNCHVVPTAGGDLAP